MHITHIGKIAAAVPIDVPITLMVHGGEEDDEWDRADDVHQNVENAVHIPVLEQVARTCAVEYDTENETEEASDDDCDEHHLQRLHHGLSKQGSQDAPVTA